MSETDVKKSLSAVARDQFGSSFEMLHTLVSVCPEEIWKERFSGVPFWYQVYHVVYFVEFWLRENPDGMFEPGLRREGVPPEYEYDIADGILISREEMLEYLDQVRDRVRQFFQWLRDDILPREALNGHKNFTYADIVMGQIRHIMFNVGYLDGILRSRGEEEAEWSSYNEPE